MLKSFPIAFLALFLCFTSCDKSSNTVAHVDKQDFSVEDQNLLGNNLLDYIMTDVEHFDVLNANAYSEAYEYLSSIFNSAVLTEQVGRRVEFDWKIIPLVSEDAYAFTLPGGKLLISTGFLNFIENEAELMALFAHEIYYTDQDLITSGLKDEFGGVVLGDIILGNEITMTPLIEYLRDNDFAESDVLGADMHTLELLCPFNYNLDSFMHLVERAKSTSEDITWIQNRPRKDVEWTSMMDEGKEKCTSAEGDRFEDRYEAFKEQLPE